MLKKALIIASSIVGAAFICQPLIKAITDCSKPYDEQPMKFCSPFLAEYMGTKAQQAVHDYMKSNPKEKLTNGLFRKILEDYQKEHPNIDLWSR